MGIRIQRSAKGGPGAGEKMAASRLALTRRRSALADEIAPGEAAAEVLAGGGGFGFAAEGVESLGFVEERVGEFGALGVIAENGIEVSGRRFHILHLVVGGAELELGDVGLGG